MQNKDGISYGRVGEKKMMVAEDSAQLFWPNEDRIPVPFNHTDMVKFASFSDDTFQIVVTSLRQCLDGLEKVIG